MITTVVLSASHISLLPSSTDGVYHLSIHNDLLFCNAAYLIDIYIWYSTQKSLDDLCTPLAVQTLLCKKTRVIIYLNNLKKMWTDFDSTKHNLSKYKLLESMK